MDELDLIANLPASPEDTESPDAALKAQARARARVMATIAASAQTGPRTTVRRKHIPRHARGSSSPRTLRYGVAAVAAAITVALIVPLVVTDQRGANASAVLLQLAETAGRGEAWESPGRGQFIYTRSTGQSPSCDGGSCALESFERESWIAPNGSGRIVETRGDQASDQDYARGELDFVDLQETFGWSQAQVRQHIAELAGIHNPSDFTLFVVIGQLMGETQLIPETRIGLFKIAAALPDTELLGPTSDQLGRSGIGIGYSSEGLRYEVIYDEETALVLEERVAGIGEGAEALSTDAAPGGWLVPGSRATFEDSGLVASVDERL
jgi:hypothetical protein